MRGVPVGDDASALGLLRSAAETADVGLLVLDADLRPVVANAYLRRLHGHGDRPFVVGEFPGRAELFDLDGAPMAAPHALVRELLEGGRLAPRVLRVRDEQTGELNPVLVEGRRLDHPDGTLHGLVMTMVDSAEQLRSEARLQELATVDELTGLLNRRGLLEHGAALLARLQAQGRPASLWVLDVDGLKQVNDRYGHAEGDRLLRAVAHAARTAAPEGVVARLGGDEFTIVGPADAVLADRVRALAAEVSAARGLTAAAEVTVGQADVHDAEDDLLVLLGRADTAMYRRRGMR